MSEPTPVYWSDGTYAIVRWRDVPDTVTGWYCAELWEAIIAAETSSQNIRSHVQHIGADMHNRWSSFYCKVRIADMHSPTPVVMAAVPRPLRTYDGVTAAQCLARYHYLMLRADKEITPGGLVGPSDKDLRQMGFTPGVKVTLRFLLNGYQKKVAQEQWSLALRAKTEAAKIQERNQVLVDLDFQEWE